MSRPLFARLYCPDKSLDLVLAGSSADVTIVDVHASVLLSQKFRNDIGLTVAATYTFSMAAGATISGFEMIRQDGTKVEGVIKEKTEAKQEYEKAISQGFTASLGEEQTKDIFSISVSNILPAEVVTINLRYLQPLIDDEKRDQVRFLFPRGYTQRYGSPPTANTAFITASKQPFKIEIAIQQAGPIRSVNCPSGHSVAFQPGPPEGTTAVDASHFARLTLTGPSSSLIQDVVIVISAANLDKPRCFVEPHPSPNHPTTAVGLTFVPRFSLPDVEGGMEYIFVVDRSGSMRGQNMELLREALIILLRGLPSMETTFNIVSFGDRASTLWPSSKIYSQETLDFATQHIDSMQPNYGGTEMASALDTTFNTLSKPLKKAVAVLLLTDGAAWDVGGCVSRVETAIRDLSQNDAFIRVFTVGIGSGASTDTCDSIARAGNGLALYVGQGEAMTGKCSRLIRAARTPLIVNLKVGWPGSEVLNQSSALEDDFEVVERDMKPLVPEDAVPVNLFQADAEERSDVGPPSKSDIINLPPPPDIQQAPITISTVFPGSRVQIYALLSDTVFAKGSTFPSSLKVRGQVQTTGTTVELDVPVATLLLSQSQSEGPSRPLLHTLAAKALITEHESGKFGHSSIKDEFVDAYLQKEITRLGTTYGLSSCHTSFIAVDRRSAAGTYVIPVNVPAVSALSSRDRGVYSRLTYSALPPSALSPPLMTQNLASQLLQNRPTAISSLSPGQRATTALGAASLDADGQVPVQSRAAVFGYHSEERGSRRRQALRVDWGKAELRDPESLESTQALRTDLPAPPAPVGPVTTFGYRAQGCGLGWNDAPQIYDRRKAEDEDPRSVESRQRLAAIARLQRFDGGFIVSEKLLQLLQASIQDVETVERLFSTAGIDPDIGATMLASVWLGKNAGEEADDMINKAENWMRQKSGLAISELSVKVVSLVSFV